jgi:tetratricopeptide (TPR) repeat protein
VRTTLGGTVDARKLADFAAALLAFKTGTGLSYRALAAGSHISAAALHRYCAGSAFPADFTSISQLARRYGASLPELTRLEELWLRAHLSIVEIPIPLDRVIPAQLPAAPPDLVGRAAELRELDRLLPRVRRALQCPPVAIVGPAGVGKTALLLRWAYAHRHEFPDGQLFLDLRGFGAQEPQTASDALASLLGGLGVGPAELSAAEPDRAALFRSLTSDRRMLLVLDNAAGSGHLESLLPGGSGVLTVVTSRRLDGPVVRGSTRLITLAPLSAVHSRRMVAELSGRSGDDSDVGEVAGLCGGLPLALRIAAARLHRADNARGFVAALRHETTRLSAPGAESGEVAVRAALSASLRRLTPSEVDVFRLVGLHPGAHPSVAVCAAMAGQSAESFDKELTSLVEAHLIERSGGYVHMHDLVRAFAAEESANLPHPTDALRKAAQWYIHAMSALFPGRSAAAGVPAPTAEPPQVADAKAWLDREMPNLLAMIATAERQGWTDETWRLVLAASPLLSLRVDRPTAVRILQTALAAVQTGGPPQAIGVLTHALGIAYGRLRDYDSSIRVLREAIDLRERIGDHDGLIASLANLGEIYGDMGRPRQAITELRRVVRLAGDGDIRKARALNDICLNLERLGRPRASLGLARQALAAGTGDERTQAFSLIHLTNAYAMLGRADESRRTAQEAIETARRVGDPYCEASALVSLGDLDDAAGDLDAARGNWSRALKLLTALGDAEADGVRERLSRH